MAQWVPFKDDFVEPVNNGILRGVIVHAHFLQNHAALLFQLPGRKHRVERQVGEQLKRPLKMRAEQGRIEADFLLGGVGVQFAAHRFEAVEDVEALALFGAFKRHVLPEVGQALLVWGLIARANVEQKATVRNLGVQHLLMQQADTVRIFVKMIVGHKFTKIRRAVTRDSVSGPALYVTPAANQSLAEPCRFVAARRNIAAP